jgi:predicted DsbA family dithiol-disulfide isomerase
MARPTVRAGTVAVFSDVICGWATVSLHRFYAARKAAGLDSELHVDLQPFLLEDVNQMAHGWRIIEPEKPVLGALEEELGFTAWQGDLAQYPVSTLLANEAVQAANQQSSEAAEELDMALRLGFWRDSRCITMEHEVLAIAERCQRVDASALREALDAGTTRAEMMCTYRRHRDAVQGSPHYFLADGSDVHNPGIDLHQVGEAGTGFLVVDHDDPKVYDDLVRRAAAQCGTFTPTCRA